MSWKEFQNRIPTEDELLKWWTQWPFANIGIVTGKISGITVVDIDTYKPDYTPLEKFPETETVMTGNGGYHLFYEYQEGMTISANAYKDLPGVDIRSDGGFVVAVPSVTSYLKDGKQAGGEYKYIKTIKQAPFPKALFPVSKVKKTLDDTVGVAVGGRNDSIASAIGLLLTNKKMEVWETEVWPAVEKINKTYVPPLGAKELRTTWLSICKKEKAHRVDEKKQDKFLMTPPNKDGDTSVIRCQENVLRALRFTEGITGKFRYNGWYNRREVFENGEWRPLEDKDYQVVQSTLANSYKHMAMIQAPSAYIQNSIIQYCAENYVDPAVNSMKALVWDGTPRLATWLHMTYNVPDTAYYSVVGTQWLKALVKRIMVPGCKFDNVLVLEGKQGIGKSSSLRAIVGNWFVEITGSPDSKDFFMLLQGASIAEFSEGETINRTSMKLLKSIITNQIDIFRAPYERETKAHPRRCVFAMSINNDEYLRDETGNRRFLPVECVGKVNIDWLKANRNQLLAEAYHKAITLDENLYEGLDSEDAREIQEHKRIKRPEEDKIVHWYLSELDDLDREAGVSSEDIFEKAIKVPNMMFDKMTPLVSSIISQVMTNILHCTKARKREVDGRPTKYFPTDEGRKLWPKETSVLFQANAPIDKLVRELNEGKQEF